MLDRDLAKLYGAGTRDLNKAVKRNIERFPKILCFSWPKESLKALCSWLEHQVGVAFASYLMFLPNKGSLCFQAC